MCFVHNNDVIAREKWIVHHFSHEHPIREIFDSRAWAHPLVKAHRIPDQRAEALPLLIGDAGGK